ncbi:MAG TPA: hypothetical protein VN616_06710 [Puia sp.]|nr:hypothetical protein [Puia sp.]
MLRKHIFLIGIVVGLVLIAIATTVYPGGSAFNPASVGFSWKYNYMCNLFGGTAVNGAVNNARSWAICGWFVMCFTNAIFFVRFATRISAIGASRIVCYCGVLGAISAFLAVTPLHDIAITCTLVFLMTAVLYILIFVFKSKRAYLKVLGLLTMVVTYLSAYVYYTGTFLQSLATLQKASLFCILTWFLCLNYFTTKDDFRVARA